MENEQALLTEIDDALARIDNGTYGICEGCQKYSIMIARLEILPHTRYCVEWQEEQEKNRFW